MLEPITFYDIPGNFKGIAWSPNTWKTRFSLNIKGLPYKTIWVEYPDIEALCKKIGAEAAEKRADGSPLYTLPVIYDPNTKVVVADSAKIARYLDRTYPDTLRLIPPEADALTAAFEDAFWSAFPSSDLAPILHAGVCAQLRPRSQQYYRNTREKRWGKLEDLTPLGSEKRAQHWAKVQGGVHQIASWLEADGKEKLFFLGDVIGVTYADIIVAGFFMWIKKACGDDGQEWADIKTLDGGRWARLMAAFEQYEIIDVGEDAQL